MYICITSWEIGVSLQTTWAYRERWTANRFIFFYELCIEKTKSIYNIYSPHTKFVAWDYYSSSFVLDNWQMRGKHQWKLLYGWLWRICWRHIMEIGYRQATAVVSGWPLSRRIFQGLAHQSPAEYSKENYKNFTNEYCLRYWSLYFKTKTPCSETEYPYCKTLFSTVCDYLSVFLISP